MEHRQNSDQENSEKRNRMKWFPIMIGIIVVLSAVLGIGIYNAPQNRILRLLDLGNRYISEENYEEAVLAFEKAIAIDERNMEAYVGGLEAYFGKGIQEETEDFYQRMLAVLDGLDSEYVERNMHIIVELYLAADRVYAGNPEKAAEVLETGFVKTGGNEEIKSSLTADYQNIAREKTAQGNYEGALRVYDRLLELDAEDQEMIEGLCGCLNDYIDILMEQGNYDRIRELAEKYRAVARGVNFGGILAVIERQERLMAENAAYMQKLYDLMAAENYDALQELYVSEETADFVERMEDSSYIFLPEGGTSGTGVGLYMMDFGYYFYYGDYVQGERKGKGTEFLYVGSVSPYIFAGAWDRDKPNGAGEVRIFNFIYADLSRTAEEVVWQGQLVDGLWDGNVKCVMTDGNENYDLSFTANRGIPAEDKTQDFLREWGAYPTLAEGTSIYAYDIIYSGGEKHVVTQKWSEGQMIGIWGFANVD